MNLGEKIQKHRKQKGMSQEELASQITVSRQAVSKWELGESVPDTENVIQLSKLFAVSTDYLLNDDYESDMDIPVVQESTDKLKKMLYKRLSSIVLIVIFYAALISLAIIYHSILPVIVCIVFTVSFAVGILIYKVVYKRAIKNSQIREKR
jgi:transcriptional regulator with XRE-family HTH domain